MKTLGRMAVVLFMTMGVLGCSSNEDEVVTNTSLPVNYETLSIGNWVSTEMRGGCNMPLKLSFTYHDYRADIPLQVEPQDGQTFPCSYGGHMATYTVDGDKISFRVSLTKWYTYQAVRLSNNMLTLSLIGNEAPVWDTGHVIIPFDLSGTYTLN